MRDLYVDQLLGITVMRGVARLDFARVEEVDTDENKMKLSSSYRIAMPLDVLMPLAEQAGKAAADLKERMQKKQADEKE
ncbi:hypothetical protein [uncultured Endozoicomonas sp.]|uniref:hypothetical protein n=1 Tax=uncultured Endozoicomonas sp. TaxID=432652 RepID=UPI00260B7506|nr:hypothetical protein [uncultured Endozoicomonas sp.]